MNDIKFIRDNAEDFNKGIIEKEFSLWRIEPLKWWILDKDISLNEDLGSSLDLSHSFTCLYIYGKASSLNCTKHLQLLQRNSISKTSEKTSKTRPEP